MTEDTCQVHRDCGSCIHDPSHVCGWCDGIITFTDNSTCGSDGKGCCGGSSSFSKCNVAYRKTCPVICDWTNWTQPQCRSATGKEIIDPTIHKYGNCDIVDKYKACVYEKQYFYCDDARGCQGPLTKAECTTEKRCNVSSPDCNRTQCKAPVQYTCNTKLGQCSQHPGPATNSSYNTSADCMKVCAKPVQYVCDKTRGQCTKHMGPATNTSYNTSGACMKACSNHVLKGVWRAISINKDFVDDEWDFFFGSEDSGAKVVVRSKKIGKTYHGTYKIGSFVDQSIEKFGAYEVNITLNNGPSPHQVLQGVFNSQNEGPITRHLFLGAQKKSEDKFIKTFDSFMDLQEFVLISCLPSQKHCDFSSANPDLSDFEELFV